jgi:transcriptional regulator with XRE-family HTH domain
MSIREVADKAGLSPDGVRNLLIGKATSPRATTLQRIADALGVPGTRLMQGFATDEAVPAPAELPPGWVDVPQVSPMDVNAKSLLDVSPDGLWRMPEPALATFGVKPADAVIVRFAKRESPEHGPGSYFLVTVDPGILPPRRGGWVIVRDPGYGHALVEYRRSGDGLDRTFSTHDAEGKEVDRKKLDVAGLIVSQIGR